MTIIRPHDPGVRTERALALSYAPAAARHGLAALFALDERLGEIVATTTEPLLGQMRLTWWHDAVAGLGSTPAPPEPMLEALARDVVGPIAAIEVAALTDGWEILFEKLDDVSGTRFAAERGARLFRLAEVLTRAAAPAGAGEGWALADLAARAIDPAVGALAAALARPLVTAALARRWPVAARSLGALTVLAGMDLDRTSGDPPRYGAPRRVARLAWHRLTGR